MALVFSDSPFVKDESPKGFLAVWLQGQDSSTDVDCRVIATALTQRCGADGLTNPELLRAFNEHRQEIEAIAIRKYAKQQTELRSDRVIVWIGPDDF